MKGCLFSLSYVSVATILSPPNVPDVLMLSLWRSVFLRGLHLCPPLAVFSGLCCFANAYLTHRHEAHSVTSDQGSSRVYPLLIAGSLMIGIVPYTLKMIVPIEEIMLQKEAKLTKARQPAAELDSGVNGKAEGLGSEGSAAETRGLLKRWVMLNYGRTMLPFAGALVAWSVR
ncbi:hypothetical protein MMC16_006077 [Acarospora aff. strigata]|nr:hypothetical protein [Acarospora aff. strigata]